MLTTGGTLALSDLDATDATVVPHAATAGSYGTFGINAAAMSATAPPTRSTSYITGTKNIATLTSDTKALTETNAALTTGGTLTLADLDATDATVVPHTGTAGSYGTFSINAAGVWSYSTTDALNQLNDGQVVTEVFNVATSDGGTATVTVNITGSQDVATLTSDTKALTETNAALTTGGTLTLADLDATDATVVPHTGTAGTYGTFSIDAAGVWSYTTTDALNQLDDGQVVTEIFNVATSDGGTATVTVNITGSQDVGDADK